MLVQHVLLHYATITQVCSHLKMIALAQFVTIPPNILVADRAVSASTTTIKNRYSLMCVCVRERGRDIKEKQAFVYAAAQHLIQGESPGKNCPGSSRTTRRQDHLARA